MAMSDATIIYKRHDRNLDSGNGTNGSLVGSEDEEIFTEAQQEVVCRLVAMMTSELSMNLADHGDMLTTLRERVAAVEASLSTMMSLLSDSKTVKSLKTIEATSEVVRKRKVKVRE
jgi:hypothetical protein